MNNAVNAQAGVLAVSSGNVYVERQGTRTSLSSGDAILSTDTVVTDNGATAEVRFLDGSTASLSPGTTLEVKDFAFGEGVQPSFILNLTQGTIRSVSGEVVKQNPDAFKLVTPQATMGIRGTEFFTAVNGGQEVHAVLHIGKDHIVVITSHDGRSIVMDDALQAVRLQGGDTGSLMKQTFSLNEMQQVIKTLAPSQVQKPIQPGGPDPVQVPGQQPEQVPVQDAAQVPPSQEQAQTQGTSTEAAATATASSSTTVLIIYETETTGAANSAQGGHSTDTLISVVEQLQGGLADAGFSVRVGAERSVLDSGLLPTTESGAGTETVPGDNGLQGVANEPSLPSTEAPTQAPTEAPTTPPTEAPTQAPTEAPTTPPTEAPTTPPTEAPTLPSTEAPTEAPTQPQAKYPNYKDFGAAESADHLNNVNLNEAQNVKVSGTLSGLLLGNAESISDVGASTTSDTLVGGSIVTGGGLLGDASRVVVTSGTTSLGNDTLSYTTMKNVAGEVTPWISGDADVALVASGGTLKFGSDSISGGSLDGTSRIYGDACTTAERGWEGGGKIILGNDTIKIGQMRGSTEVFGDIEGGGYDPYITYEQGNDSIVVAKMSDDAKVHGGLGNDLIHVGTIVGNVQVNGGAGNDIIKVVNVPMGNGQIVPGMMTGGTVSGGDGDDTIEVAWMSGGRVMGDAGADRITVGDMNGGTVDGGAGNDAIIFTNPKEGRDDGILRKGMVNGGDGDDIITASWVAGGQINGDAGADSITITRMQDGTVSGGGGNDVVEVTWMSGGLIKGDAGADRITIRDMSAGTVQGGADNDTILFTQTPAGGGAGDIGILRNGLVSGGDGNDTIEAAWMTGGEINGDGGVDSISITVLAGGKVDGGDGGDIIKVGKMAGLAASETDPTLVGGNATVTGGAGNDDITVDAMYDNARVYGGDGNDTILVKQMHSGLVSGDAGTDTITISNMSGGTVDGGAHNDSITVTGMSNGVVLGGEGDDHISVTNMGGGRLDGGSGNDTITVKDMSGGRVSAGAGKDSVTIQNMSGGTVDMSTGSGDADVRVFSSLDNHDPGMVRVSFTDGSTLQIDGAVISGMTVTDPAEIMKALIAQQVVQGVVMSGQA